VSLFTESQVFNAIKITQWWKIFPTVFIFHCIATHILFNNEHIHCIVTTHIMINNNEHMQSFKLSLTVFSNYVNASVILGTIKVWNRKQLYSCKIGSNFNVFTAFSKGLVNVYIHVNCILLINIKSPLCSLCMLIFTVIIIDVCLYEGRNQADLWSMYIRIFDCFNFFY